MKRTAGQAKSQQIRWLETMLKIHSCKIQEVVSIRGKLGRDDSLKGQSAGTTCRRRRGASNFSKRLTADQLFHTDGREKKQRPELSDTLDCADLAPESDFLLCGSANRKFQPQNKLIKEKNDRK